MEEIWKDVPGYEGLYQASNLGKIKSFYRKTPTIMKTNLTKRGYFDVNLRKNKIKERRTVHQVIAITFLNHKPDLYNKVINHINFNKLDNRLCNLEIVTQRENANQKHLKSISKYVGVTFCSKTKRFVSSIKINKKSIFLIKSTDEIKCSKMYNSAVKNIKFYKGNNNEFRELLRAEVQRIGDK